MVVTVVGLSGPMGAGKSHVLVRLAELGAAALRADDASRELLKVDSRLLSEIKQCLGAGIFQADGSLDRKATASLIFQNPEARLKLEGILHGPMVQWLKAQIDALQQAPQPPEMVVIEAAILTHMGARPLCDVITRVWAPREICLQRMSRRDNISSAEAENRMSIHDNLGLFDEPADYVIDTSGTVAQTDRNIEDFWRWLQARQSDAV